MHVHEHRIEKPTKATKPRPPRGELQLQPGEGLAIRLTSSLSSLITLRLRIFSASRGYNQRLFKTWMILFTMLFAIESQTQETVVNPTTK